MVHYARAEGAILATPSAREFIMHKSNNMHHKFFKSM